MPIAKPENLDTKCYCFNLAECVAVNGAPCIFPFNYHGKTFDKCTHYDANFGKVWCAVAVNSGGEMTTWKDCDTEACKGKMIFILK